MKKLKDYKEMEYLNSALVLLMNAVSDLSRWDAYNNDELSEELQKLEDVTKSMKRKLQQISFA